MFSLGAAEISLSLSKEEDRAYAKNSTKSLGDLPRSAEVPSVTRKVVMSGVNNYQQATRGTPDVSCPGAERGPSFPAPPARERCGGQAGRQHMEGSQLGAAPKPAPRQR